MKFLALRAMTILNDAQDMAINLEHDTATRVIELRKRRINKWFSKRYDIDADITHVRVSESAGGEYIETGISPWLRERTTK